PLARDLASAWEALARRTGQSRACSQDTARAAASRDGTPTALLAHRVTEPIAGTSRAHARPDGARAEAGAPGWCRAARAACRHPQRAGAVGLRGAYDVCRKIIGHRDPCQAGCPLCG